MLDARAVRDPFVVGLLRWTPAHRVSGVLCPVCGGREMRSLGQDSFECTSQVRVGDQLVGVVPRNPYQPFEVPVYHPVYGACGHHFTAQQATAMAEQRARHARQQQEASRAQAERDRLKEAEEAERRAWEDERDRAIMAELPTIAVPPHPGSRPGDSEPDIFWFLGFFPYWIGGTVVIWLILATLRESDPDQGTFILATSLAAAAYLSVLGFWLVRAFRLRQAHGAALRAHESAAEAERQRESERARLRASRPYPGG